MKLEGHNLNIWNNLFTDEYSKEEKVKLLAEMQRATVKLSTGKHISFLAYMLKQDCPKYYCAGDGTALTFTLAKDLGLF